MRALLPQWRELIGQGWGPTGHRWLNILAPCNWWIRQYTFKDFRLDLFAGITVALIVIPQGMGYAKNAGMLPIAGLYAASTPLFIYAYFGTSRQLSVGPVAVLSNLVGVNAVNFINPAQFKGAANVAAQNTYNQYVSFTMVSHRPVHIFVTCPLACDYNTPLYLIKHRPTLTLGRSFHRV